MNKKIIAIIIVILLVIVGVFAYTQLNTDNTVKVGKNSKISIPEGFKLDKVKGAKTYLKNDVTTLSIKEVENPEPLNTLLQAYNTSYSEKYTVETGEKTVGDTPVVWGCQKDGDKLIAYDYWYEKNEKTYHITLIKENNETAIDSIINSTS